VRTLHAGDEKGNWGGGAESTYLGKEEEKITENSRWGEASLKEEKKAEGGETVGQ